MTPSETLKRVALGVEALFQPNARHHCECQDCGCQFIPDMRDWAEGGTSCPDCGTEVWLKVLSKEAATIRELQEDAVGQKVFVYFNLHNHKWSVKAMQGPAKGRVIGHADVVTLKDVQFKVSEAGRQRVLKEQCKNVHAGCVGTLVSWGQGEAVGQRVSYNPYKAGYFYDVTTGDPVEKAHGVVMLSKQVWIPPQEA